MSRAPFIPKRPSKPIELMARNPVFRAAGHKPMVATKQTDLALKARLAFESFQSGTANHAERGTLASVVNISMVLARKHCGAEDLIDAQEAQEALLRADSRVLNGKQWSFDDEGQIAMLRALSVYEQQIAQIGQASITDAVLTVMKMQSKGQVHRAGVVENNSGLERDTPLGQG